MKKLLLINALILSFWVTTSAQEKTGYIPKPRLSIGGELLIPTDGSFAELFSTGAGFSGKFEVPVTTRFYGTLTAGFTKFMLKDKYESLTFNKTYVPLKAGAKYYLKSVYTEAELGASVGTNKGAGTALAGSIGAGLSFPVTADGYIDAGARYEKWDRKGGNIGQAGFRVAYKF